MAKAQPQIRAVSRHSDVIEQVIDQIRRDIRSGALRPGDKLQSEIGFATKLNVSRSAVSKAYSKLEAFGLTQTIPQSGTYLAEIGSDALIDFVSSAVETAPSDVDSSDMHELYRLRSLLEQSLAAWAAENATDSQLEALVKKSESVAKKILHGDGGIDDDLTFHIEIAELSGKPFFRSLLFFLTMPMVRSFRAFQEKQPKDQMAARWEKSMKEHQEIVAAIVARDTVRARQAVEAHFANSISYLNT